ncbi:MAG: HAMP domain-containing sensor histidine kinase [Cetobacterium sp.]|uniref:sensor histidine kinase n=1 Tax=Cetobacterium sp. TaxID=2071632 RepID=UPI002FC73D91
MVKQFKKILETLETTISECNDISFCKNAFANEHNKKKCISFYKKLFLKGEENEIAICPYGFTTYKKNGLIYTSFLLHEYYDKKKVEGNLKQESQILQDFQIYTKERLEFALRKEEKAKIIQNTLHDLKNNSNHIMDMIEEFKQNHNDFLRSDSNIDSNLTKRLNSLISGYEFIRYRLNVHGKTLDETYLGEFEESFSENEIKLHPILLKLVSIMRAKAKKKEIRFDLDSKTERIYRISSLLYLVLFIVLENAIKYSLPQNKIVITFEESSREYETKIIIENKTKKLKLDELDQLFTRGVRGDNAISIPGSGYGLSIVKGLCDQSKIKINLEKDESDESKDNFRVLLTVSKV